MIELHQTIDDQWELRRDGLRSGTRATSEALNDELRRQFMLDVGFLPPGLKYISPSRSFWVFQYPPRLQPIFYHATLAGNVDARTPTTTYELPLPWTLMVVEVSPTYVASRVWLFAISGPLVSRRVPVRLATMPLPNHYCSGQICLPDDMPLRFDTIGEGIVNAYTTIFSSYSNADTRQNFAYSYEYSELPFLTTHNLRGRAFYAQWEKTPIRDVVEEWTFAPALDSFLYPEHIFDGGSRLFTTTGLLASIESADQASHHNVQMALQMAFARSAS